MTYTFAVLDVSLATYDEIARKLRAAEYRHAFVKDVIDMHGIALRALPAVAPLVRAPAPTETEVARLQRCILNAADALVAGDRDEAYHQLYGAVDPTYTTQGDPFQRLRAALGAPVPDDRRESKPEPSTGVQP